MNDCVFLKPRGCSILNVRLCEYPRCAFYKNRAMYDESNRKVRERHKKLGIISGSIYNKNGIKCIETGIEYASVAEAARALGVQPTNIYKAVSGQHKTSCGYHWEYLEEKHMTKAEIHGILLAAIKSGTKKMKAQIGSGEVLIEILDETTIKTTRTLKSGKPVEWVGSPEDTAINLYIRDLDVATIEYLRD